MGWDLENLGEMEKETAVGKRERRGILGKLGKFEGNSDREKEKE